MLRRTAIKTLGLGAISLALPLPLLAKKATPGPRIIWHRNHAFVPALLFPEKEVVDVYGDGSGESVVRDWEYWAEIRGHADPSTWRGRWWGPGPEKAPNDYLGTWVFGISTYDSDKRDYSAAPQITAISCAYRVPYRTWAFGQDMTVEPNLSDPAWQVRVSMAHLLFRTPKTYLDQPYPL